MWVKHETTDVQVIILIRSHGDYKESPYNMPEYGKAF